MTERRGRGRPDPQSDDANLSEQDLERRLAGDAGLGGPVPERTPPPIDPGVTIGAGAAGSAGLRAVATGAIGRGGGPGRRDGGPSSPRRPIWRDAGLVLVLLVLLAAGARVVLPSEPATAQTSPSTAASQVAVLPSPTPTIAPITATSPSEAALSSDVPSLAPSPSPSAAPSTAPSTAPTTAPTPPPTVAPGQTPKPTPKPIPKPAPTPTPPATATLTVYLQVINDDGGTRQPGSWTVAMSGAGASPGSFTGSQSGTLVTVLAGQAYSVGTLGPSGYSRIAAGDCTGPLAAGAHGLCTITKDDLPAGVQATTVVTNGAYAGDPSHFTVSITATNPSPPTAQGSGTGTTFTFWANHSYSVGVSNLDTYIVAGTTGSCSGVGVNGSIGTCTLTLTDPTASSTDPISWAFVLFIPAAWPPRRTRRFRRAGQGRA